MKLIQPAAVCVGAFALVLSGATAASAGEVTGNGKPTQGPAHSNSLCAYSGQNDEPDDPEEGGRVQSYGQIVKAGFKAFVPSPSVGCNPTAEFEE